jgi:hypothetical protein
MFVSCMKDGRVFVKESRPRSGIDGPRDTVRLSYIFWRVVFCFLWSSSGLSLPPIGVW